MSLKINDNPEYNIAGLMRTDYPELLEDTECDIVPEDLSVGRIESDDTMKRIY